MITRNVARTMILYLIGQLWCYPGQEVDVFVCMKPRHLIRRRTFGPLYKMRGTVKQDELIDRTRKTQLQTVTFILSNILYADTSSCVIFIR